MGERTHGLTTGGHSHRVDNFGTSITERQETVGQYRRMYRPHFITIADTVHTALEARLYFLYIPKR